MKTYPITLAQIEALADALAACDGHVHAGQDKTTIHHAHGILMEVLGTDEEAIYGPEDEPEAPPRPIVAAVKAAIEFGHGMDAYWKQYLPDGSIIREATVKNALTDDQRSHFRDDMHMRMCTQHGRLFQKWYDV